jgi:hypothetical protein
MLVVSPLETKAASDVLPWEVGSATRDLRATLALLTERWAFSAPAPGAQMLGARAEDFHVGKARLATQTGRSRAHEGSADKRHAAVNLRSHAGFGRRGFLLPDAQMP